jgi:cytochrome P450
MSVASNQFPAGVALFGPAMLEDPYPIYHQLRSFDPVLWNERIPGWIVTRYADVNAALRDGRLSSERAGRLQARLGEAFQPLVDSQSNAMLSTDAPRHTRLRGLVSKAFTPRAVEAMRPAVQRIVDEYLDAVAPKGGMDVMADLASPLPVTVIAEMLGIPPTDRERFKQWSDEITLILGNLIVNIEDEAYRRSLQSYLELRDYYAEIIKQLRDHPNDSLLSAMIAAEEQGDRLNEAELYANAILLLNAGHETTTNLIGNGLLALLRHPDQLQKLKDDPSRIANAVEELLRFDSPVQFTSRIAKEDLEFGGKAIQQGQSMILILGAANRDPEQFPNPDMLDVTRPEIHHVAFGAGPHYCLGAPLARLEGEIVFSTLLRRFPNIRLGDAIPRHRENFNLRGLKALKVML